MINNFAISKYLMINYSMIFCREKSPLAIRIWDADWPYSNRVNIIPLKIYSLVELKYTGKNTKALMNVAEKLSQHIELWFLCSKIIKA